MSVSEVASKPGQPWLSHKKMRNDVVRDCQNGSWIKTAVDAALANAGVVTEEAMYEDSAWVYGCHPRYFTADDHRELLRFVCYVKEKNQDFPDYQRYYFGPLYGALLRYQELTLAQDVAQRANLDPGERLAWGAKWVMALHKPGTIPERPEVARIARAIERDAYRQRWPFRALLQWRLLEPLLKMAYDVAGSAGYANRFTPQLLWDEVNLVEAIFPAHSLALLDYPRPLFTKIWATAWPQRDTFLDDTVQLPKMAAWELAVMRAGGRLCVDLAEILQADLADIPGGPSAAVRALLQVGVWCRDQLRPGHGLPKQVENRLQHLGDYLDRELPNCCA